MSDHDAYDIVARVAVEALERFHYAAARAAGADEPSAEAVTRALVGASLLGVDTHGVRLLPNYVTVLADGRTKGAPTLRFERKAPSVGLLDADNGLGHRAGYAAIEQGIAIAEETGLAAISVINTSHYGPAGAYVLAAAERGYIALSCCNTDKIVLPFDGLKAFHGTNPIAVAAPVPGERPYLIDMATSPIPWNRVFQYGALGRPVPSDVVVDADAAPTHDATQAVAALPFGGPVYGYKGAALGSLVEIFCGALGGRNFSFEIPDDLGPDFAEPRGLGQFYLVIKPEAFLSAELYGAGIKRYLAGLRSQPARSGTTVMAPGDREWATRERRSAKGIPIDRAVWGQFAEIAERFGLASLEALPA
ncbi:MAG: Ldh family oxidoreductase [Kiloniellales bacterium]|nr:Ldh family oxidoreductase [Kiloniellales bacterium]